MPYESPNIVIVPSTSLVNKKGSNTQKTIQCAIKEATSVVSASVNVEAGTSMSLQTTKCTPKTAVKPSEDSDKCDNKVLKDDVTIKNAIYGIPIPKQTVRESDSVNENRARLEACIKTNKACVSWASNYLKSIGQCTSTYQNKPTKQLNISPTSDNRVDVASACDQQINLLSQSKMTETAADKKIEPSLVGNISTGIRSNMETRKWSYPPVSLTPATQTWTLPWPYQQTQQGSSTDNRPCVDATWFTHQFQTISTHPQNGYFNQNNIPTSSVPQKDSEYTHYYTPSYASPMDYMWLTQEYYENLTNHRSHLYPNNLENTEAQTPCSYTKAFEADTAGKTRLEAKSISSDTGKILKPDYVKRSNTYKNTPSEDLDAPKNFCKETMINTEPACNKTYFKKQIPEDSDLKTKKPVTDKTHITLSKPTSGHNSCDDKVKSHAYSKTKVMHEDKKKPESNKYEKHVPKKRERSPERSLRKHKHVDTDSGSQNKRVRRDSCERPHHKDREKKTELTHSYCSKLENERISRKSDKEMTIKITERKKSDRDFEDKTKKRSEQAERYSGPQKRRLRRDSSADHLPNKRRYNSENIDDDTQCKNNIPLKSVVMLPKNPEVKRSRKGSKDEFGSDFDLRSILSGINYNLCKSSNNCDENQSNNNVETEREDLNTSRNVNPTTIEPKPDPSKSKHKKKKIKNIRLVINVICENQDDSSDDSSSEETNSKDAIHSTNIIDESETKAKSDLSFLDDINIDEIVASLQHNATLDMQQNIDQTVFESTKKSAKSIKKFVQPIVIKSENAAPDMPNIDEAVFESTIKSLKSTKNFVQPIVIKSENAALDMPNIEDAVFESTIKSLKSTKNFVQPIVIKSENAALNVQNVEKAVFESTIKSIKSANNFVRPIVIKSENAALDVQQNVEKAEFAGTIKSIKSTKNFVQPIVIKSENAALDMQNVEKAVFENTIKSLKSAKNFVQPIVINSENAAIDVQQNVEKAVFDTTFKSIKTTNNFVQPIIVKSENAALDVQQNIEHEAYVSNKSVKSSNNFVQPIVIKTEFIELDISDSDNDEKCDCISEASDDTLNLESLCNSLQDEMDETNKIKNSDFIRNISKKIHEDEDEKLDNIEREQCENYDDRLEETYDRLNSSNILDFDGKVIIGSENNSEDAKKSMDTSVFAKISEIKKSVTKEKKSEDITELELHEEVQTDRIVENNKPYNACKLKEFEETSNQENFYNDEKIIPGFDDWKWNNYLNSNKGVIRAQEIYLDILKTTEEYTKEKTVVERPEPDTLINESNVTIKSYSNESTENTSNDTNTIKITQPSINAMKIADPTLEKPITSCEPAVEIHDNDNKELTEMKKPFDNTCVVARTDTSLQLSLQLDVPKPVNTEITTGNKSTTTNFVKFDILCKNKESNVDASGVTNIRPSIQSNSILDPKPVKSAPEQQRTTNTLVNSDIVDKNKQFNQSENKEKNTEPQSTANSLSKSNKTSEHKHKDSIENKEPITDTKVDQVRKVTLTPPSLKADKVLALKIEKRISNYLHHTLNVVSLIRSGKFSKVFRCKNTNNQNLALKLIRDEKNFHSLGVKKEKMWLQIQDYIPRDNLNTVYLIGGFSLDRTWCFLMEYYPKNLGEALKETVFNMDEVLNLTKQLVSAVFVMKNNNVIHSDIKPTHILLDESNKKLKVCGFDRAYYADDNKKVLPNFGSMNYRPPEVILGYQGGYSIDVWATALVIYEMIAGEKLFKGFCFNNIILYKQMCVLGNLPVDMVLTSLYAHRHFAGTVFKRKTGPREGQFVLYNLNKFRQRINMYDLLMPRIVRRRKFRHNWAKDQELAKLENLGSLLDKMLILDPRKRIPIEFVYAEFVYNTRFRYSVDSSRDY